MDFGITQRAFVKSMCNICMAANPKNNINGLNFLSFVSGQYDVYKTPDCVGYVQLSGGELNAYFPNLYGKVVYHHEFEDKNKRDFTDEAEKQKYLSLVADTLKEYLKDFEDAHFSEDENILWEYYASITGEKMADIRGKKEIKHFPLFMWVFGCENTVKVLGLKKVKEYFRKEAFSYNADGTVIEHEDIMEALPSLRIKEDYAWLRKLICKYPRATEEKILKLYDNPVDTKKELNKRFPNRHPLLLLGYDSGIFPFDSSLTDYGTFSFYAGVNPEGENGDIVVYLDGEETDNKQLKDIMTKCLNNYHKANWVCVASFMLRTSAYDYKITLDEETEKPVMNNVRINARCLSLIARDINESTGEHCLYHDWEEYLWESPWISESQNKRS